MSVIHGQQKPTIDTGVLVFPIVCGLFLVAIFFRLWYFQVVLSSSLTERASLSTRATAPEMAPRGLIYDRDGNLLAGVRPALVVTAIPAVIAKHPEVLPQVAEMLGTTPKLLERKLKQGLNRRLPVPIFVGASVEVGARIAEAGTDLPGIGIDTQPMRYDTDTVDFTHLLGRVWVPSRTDIERIEKQGNKPAEYVGKDGLEWYYEADLMGQPGTKEVEVDAKHRPVKVIGRDSPVPGTKLELSIDSKLQKLATDILGDPHGEYKIPPGHRAAIVALDPANGEVLCLASSPTFELVQGRISKDVFDALNTDEDKPFLNRPLACYAPGSTFKIITSLAMQETGIFNPSVRVFCDGAFHMGKSKIICLGHHGSISYVEALERSCNTYFCTMGTKAAEVDPEALTRAGTEMGLGVPAGLDISNDVKAGVVPDAEYKEAKKWGHWYTGDTANTAIGQGFVLASPLQMADVAAMVANHGVMYRPHLVHAKGLTKTTMEVVTPEVIHKVDAPESFWDTLIQGLDLVIQGPKGTGVNARIPGVDWCGKTGSAEHQTDEKTHSWFIGFAPLDHPRIAVAVLVESAGHGNDVAAPIARDIVKAYLLAANARVKSSKTD